MFDFSEIKNSLLKIYPFSEEQLNLFAEQSVCKKLKKKDFLLKKNQVSDGSLRFYSETENTDLTLNFITENSWFADIESLLTQKPSANYIEAFEDSKIATIKMIDIHHLMDIHPCFRMLLSLLSKLTISSSHVATINIKKPDERYRELLANHPDWINRFSQMQIASVRIS